MNNNTFKETIRALEKRRNDNIEEHSRRKKQVYSKSSAIREIDSKMAENALEIIRCVFSGEKQLSVKKKNQELKAQKMEHLVSLGYTPNYLDEIFNCKKCRDTGFIGTKKCKCFEIEYKKQGFLNSNLGAALCGQTFETFDLGLYSKEINKEYGMSPQQIAAANLKFLKNYANKFSLKSQNILLSGNTGLGKTFISAAVANTVVNLGYGVIYESAGDVIELSEKSHFQKNEQALEKFEEIKGCDLLILDDLGTELLTSFTETVIYNLINSRIVNGLPTIISTNLEPERLNERYSEQIVSRLTGEFIMLLFIGDDIRPKKLAAKQIK